MVVARAETGCAARQLIVIPVVTVVKLGAVRGKVIVFDGILERLASGSV